jgi:hypothetical protein
MDFAFFLAFFELRFQRLEFRPLCARSLGAGSRRARSGSAPMCIAARIRRLPARKHDRIAHESILLLSLYR